MSVLSDKTITVLCHGEKPMIHPFVPETIRHNDTGKAVVSFGLGPEGYDVRTQNHGQLANKNFSGVLSVSHPDPAAFIELTVNDEGLFVIPAGGLLLVDTQEYFHLPTNVVMVAFTKSRFARCGISLNTTKAAPGWSGYLVLEIQNNMPYPISFSPEEGVATMVFHSLDGDSDPYAGGYSGEGNLAISSVK